MSHRMNRVYDPISKTYNTGWMPIYNRNGHIGQYVPVWRDNINANKYKNGNGERK